MQPSLKDFLIYRQADTDTIQQAARYYLAERTEDLSPEEMRQRLIQAIGDAKKVDSVLRTFEDDPILAENACLALLSAAWDEAGEVQRIRSAVDSAKTKLPVIEAAIIALVGMYAMYLITTGGVKKSEMTVARNPDGSFIETVTTEYFGPSGPLSTVTSLFHIGKDQSKK